MKTTTVTLFLLVSTLFSEAGTDIYTRKMTETLAEMRNAQTVADFQKVANTFSRIAAASDENWLAHYHYANTYINLVYFDKSADIDQKEEYLELARTSVEFLLDKKADEPEVQVLDAWYWISRIGVRPMVYGMIYFGKYTSAIERSLEMEPVNPRAQFLALSQKIGQTEFFGGDISEYCPKVKKLYENWDDYKPKSGLHPDWGKEGLKIQLDKCN